MAAIVQYEFNTEGQWKNAGEPKLVEAATHITVLGLNPETGKYHVEVLYADIDDVPDNGLLNSKSIKPIPHQFIGYESLQEYEERKNQKQQLS